MCARAAAFLVLCSLLPACGDDAGGTVDAPRGIDAHALDARILDAAPPTADAPLTGVDAPLSSPDGPPAATPDAAGAASGSLDPSFGGGDGIVVTDFDADDEAQARAVVIQPDGKIVIAGFAGTAGDHSFAVARYLANGNPDPSFSGDGQVTTKLPGATNAEARALTVLSDGALIVAGSASQPGSNYDVVVARYTAGGELDPAFGGGEGFIIRTVGDGIDHAHAVTLQITNNPERPKVVVAGQSYKFSIPFDGDRMLLRFFAHNGTADGSQLEDPDPSSTGYDAFLALTGDADGRFVAAGTSGAGFLVARYLDPDSGFAFTPDPDFGDEGTPGEARPAGASAAGASAVLVQPDGRIVVAGPAAGGAVAVARLTAAGDADPSFDGDGLATLSWTAGNGYAAALGRQSDGKLVVAGYAGSVGSRDFGVARLRADGTPDGSFGQGGQVATPIEGDDAPWALAVQGDNKIVVAGFTIVSGNYKVAIVRYNP
jgi:uncharacterized delta-60 repeat protein